MQQNLVLVVVGSICVCFSCCLALRDVEFVQKPQNITLLDLKELFFFNCSTDVASNDGIDWLLRFGERHERICSSSDFYKFGENSCQLNYSMEVPNNWTLNLIVDPRIAVLGNEYCCQFDNGFGKRSCSYLTLPPEAVTVTADPALTDITTVFPDKYTTGYYSSASEESPSNKTGLIAGTVVGIGLIILAIVIIAIIWIKRKSCKNPRPAAPLSQHQEL